jgi:hypothetical protein
MDRSSKIFVQAPDAVPDTDLSQPTVLPGRTRKHAETYMHRRKTT